MVRCPGSCRNSAGRPMHPALSGIQRTADEPRRLRLRNCLFLGWKTLEEFGLLVASIVPRFYVRSTGAWYLLNHGFEGMSTAALRCKSDGFWWMDIGFCGLLWISGIQLDFLPTASGLSLRWRGSAWETYSLKIAARFQSQTWYHLKHQEMWDIPKKIRWQKHVYNCITV